jgi:ABC-type long-subunit fatty acid transport system fused permease/ATPase subunit
MDIGAVPIQVMFVAVVVLAGLFVVLRGFKLPGKYYANEREREAMRRRLIEKEYERVHTPGVMNPADKNKKK